ncbi:uncharacterized protein LOC120488660 isoform X2 [Tachysurus ichikawai]
MGKAVKCTGFRNVKIKVVRRSITGPAKFSYLGQAPPQPNSKHTHSLDPSTSITPQQAEPDDVAPNCSLCSETAYKFCSNPDNCRQNAYYEPSSLGLFLYLPEGHNTHTVYTKDMKVIVSTGRLCTVTVNMCAFEPETCTLLRYGLWPATADKPQTAFSIPLLELFVCLSLECQVSVKGFCNTLSWKNNLTLAEVNTLYRALVGESISHFRHHHFRQRSLVDVCPQLDDGTTCPACPKADGDMIVTLDATSAVEPLHGTRMFVDEKDVEDYLLSHLDSSKPHEKPGEGIPHNISLAIPAFHVYGHKFPCQIKYSTRRLGLTDGEGMERLWSFLQRFARVTKEMTPSHRLDLLTDALLHYGRRKSTDLEVQLLQRLDKAEKISILAQENICHQRGTRRHGEMEKREMELVQQKQKPINTVCRWKRDYIRLIQFYKFKIEDSLLNMEKKHSIRRRWQESDSDFQSTLKDVDCELRGQLICKARTESRERAVLLHLKRKCTDGQGIAIRLSKQEACDPSWHVYFCFDDTVKDDVSRSLKRRGIDALHMKARVAEEKRMLYQEMRSVTEHLHQQHAFLCSAIKDTEQPGSKAALIQRLHQLERKRHQAIVMFHPHVPDIVPADNPHLCQALPMPSIQTLVYNDDSDNDDSEDEYDN